MAAHNETTVWSIYGQIEEVVARQMEAEGKMRFIYASDIPDSALYNKDGQRARFAVVVQRKYLGEFESRIADLRA